MRLLKLRPNNYTILFFILVVFIVLEVIVISPRILETPDEDQIEYEKLKALAAQTNKAKAIEQKMVGVHYVESSGSEKGWELFASEAAGTADAQWILKKVRVQFFAADNSSFTVTGDVGEVDGTSKDMVIRGSVVTTSSNGYSFKTSSLRYVAKFKQMTSSDTVEMQGPPDEKGMGFKLTGVGLLVDIAKNKMTILNQVEAEKKIEEKNLTIKSLAAIFSNESQEAHFSGQVRTQFGPSLILSPNAYFFYSAKTKVLERILLKTGVKLFESEKKATCKELEFELDKDMMTLRGQPKVQQGEDEIIGNEIVFLDGGKKVKINRVGIKGTTKGAP